MDTKDHSDLQKADERNQAAGFYSIIRYALRALARTFFISSSTFSPVFSVGCAWSLTSLNIKEPDKDTSGHSQNTRAIHQSLSEDLRN